MSLPPFLHGCFDWRVNGLHWATRPPIDLSTPAALVSSEPWTVVAAVVDRAKLGDHAHAERLVPFFEQHEPFALARVALLVFADVAPAAELPRLERVLRGDDEMSRAFAAEAAALSGSLDLVPAMIEAWERARSLADHETIGFALSDMLEPELGAIAEHVGIYDLTATNPPAYTADAARVQARIAALEAEQDPPPLPALVWSEYQRLRAEHAAGAFVWAGAPIDVNRLARRFLDAVTNPDEDNFINLRHRFEAATGERCDRFFHAFQPQRLEMTATLEDFIRSDKGSRYQPGRRYFFGHSIP